jgi:uncharacterized membrane protein/uncharacterized membrane protein YeaQ/YmgE (transglycosylase-associated protein family)
MQFLIWILTGALAGWSAGKMMKGRDYGLVGNLTLGLIGGIVGGWLLHLLGAVSPSMWWQQAVVSALGALVVLGAARRLKPLARSTRSVFGEVAAAGADLEGQIRKLSEFERRVVSRMLQGQHVRDPNAAFEQQMTFGQRVADKVAIFGGSWTFIGLFLLFMLVWMVVNTELVQHFDPFPFILLNLMLSCLAALQAPVIMMSQNRQAAKDRLMAASDYDVNVRSELELARLHALFDELREKQWADLVEMQRRQIEMLENLLHGRGDSSTGGAS